MNVSNQPSLLADREGWPTGKVGERWGCALLSGVFLLKLWDIKIKTKINMADKINLNAPTGEQSKAPAEDKKISIKMEKPAKKEKKGLGALLGFGKKKEKNTDKPVATPAKPADPARPESSAPIQDQSKTEGKQPMPVEQKESGVAEKAHTTNQDDKKVEIKSAADKPATEPAEKVDSPAVAATPAPKPAEKKDDKNDTINIFNKEKEEQKDTAMMKSILQKKNPPKVKPILGAAPTLQKSIEAEKITGKKKQLRVAQSVFVFVLLAAAGMAFYFYSQLAPGFDLFGANATARLTDINKNLRSAQTSINKYRYLAAQLDLSRFSYISDEFLDKTSKLTMTALSASEVAEITQEVESAAEELPDTLINIKENLAAPLVIDTYQTEAEEETTPEEVQKQFESQLRNLLLADRKEITQNSDLSEENEQDLRLIDNTLKLIGNNKLLNTIKGVSPDDFQSKLLAYAETLEVAQREEIQKIMGDILSSTKSDIATIGAIKSQRIAWLWIIEKIEEVTAEVDPNFNSGLFEVTGFEITYNGYELDAGTNKIILSGQTKTIDANNFTDISNLIDAFEDSPYFKNVEMRSFAKSGDVESGFTANFKIDLEIETDGISPKNRPISLIPSRPVAVNTTGVKRIK